MDEVNWLLRNRLLGHILEADLKSKDQDYWDLRLESALESYHTYMRISNSQLPLEAISLIPEVAKNLEAVS